MTLGMAGNRRSSTLKSEFGLPSSRWGWPGIAAQVHFYVTMVLHGLSWGWPGIAAQVHSSNRVAKPEVTLGMAGNRRSSTLGKDSHGG